VEQFGHATRAMWELPATAREHGPTPPQLPSEINPCRVGPESLEAGRLGQR
jgi:hypothetical protein